MTNVCSFYKSTIGKKVVVAITGVMLYGFVVGHMLGNLKTFAGFTAENIHKLDVYANWLRVMGSDFAGHAGVLWGARIGLIVAAVLHIVTVMQLQALNKAARPVAYVKQVPVASSLASRTMIISGVALLLFIIFHLLHMTFGIVPIDGFVHGHVYANVFSAFQNIGMVLIYVIAMAMLAMHLFHGVWSLFQTLGLDNPDCNKFYRSIAIASAVVLFFGFIAVPVAVVSGCLPEPSTEFIESQH